MANLRKPAGETSASMDTRGYRGGLTASASHCNAEEGSKPAAPVRLLDGQAWNRR